MQAPAAPRTDYDYDVFVSYRRSNADWIEWTRDIFVRSLKAFLDLSGQKRIFIDDQIEVGARWPQRLASALARSKVLVCVLSRDYFQSEWCRLELKLMHHRQETLQTVGLDHKLIIPVVIDDGDCFPAEIQALQSHSLHAFNNPFIVVRSPEQTRLAEELRTKVCPDLDAAIAAAPTFDPTWETVAHEQFANTFRIRLEEQKTVPLFKLPKLS